MPDATSIHFDLSPPSYDERRRLESDLSDDERHVLLEHGTEAPFCGIFLEGKGAGASPARSAGFPVFRAEKSLGGGPGGRSLRRLSRPITSNISATPATA